MRTIEKKLATAMHITRIETENRVLLEKVLDDLNTLKHKTYSEELRSDINTAMGLLEKHKESFNFYNVRESILNELSDK